MCGSYTHTGQHQLNLSCLFWVFTPFKKTKIRPQKACNSAGVTLIRVTAFTGLKSL